MLRSGNLWLKMGVSRGTYPICIQYGSTPPPPLPSTSYHVFHVRGPDGIRVAPPVVVPRRRCPSELVVLVGDLHLLEAGEVVAPEACRDLFPRRLQLRHVEALVGLNGPHGRLRCRRRRRFGLLTSSTSSSLAWWGHDHDDKEQDETWMSTKLPHGLRVASSKQN